MTVRNPVVFIPGGTPVLQELPAGDTLAGAAAGVNGSNGTNGTNGSNGTNGTNGAMSQLAQVITSSSASTIHFATISGSFTNLLITLVGRDTAAGSTDLNVRMKLNSDGTSGNYTSTQFIQSTASSASGGSSAASANGGVVCEIPGSSGNANAVGSGTIWINGYSGTTFQKAIFSELIEYAGSGPSFFRNGWGFVWKNTAAITDIVLTAGGTAFVDGTTATLYGY